MNEKVWGESAVVVLWQCHAQNLWEKEKLLLVLENDLGLFTIYFYLWKLYLLAKIARAQLSSILTFNPTGVRTVFFWECRLKVRQAFFDMKNSRKNCQKTDPHFSAEFTLRVNQSGNERSRHGLGMGWTNVHLADK